jgi:hypothetical protein
MLYGWVFHVCVVCCRYNDPDWQMPKAQEGKAAAAAEAAALAANGGLSGEGDGGMSLGWCGCDTCVYYASPQMLRGCVSDAAGGTARVSRSAHKLVTKRLLGSLSSTS